MGLYICKNLSTKLGLGINYIFFQMNMVITLNIERIYLSRKMVYPVKSDIDYKKIKGRIQP